MGEEYREWLHSKGVKGLEPFEIAEFKKTGRGIAVNGELKENHVLSIPESLLISKDLIVTSGYGHLADQCTKKGVSLRDDDLFVIFLMGESIKKEKSPWAKHIEAQPTKYDQVVHWSSGQLQSLQGSNVFHLATQLKGQVQEDYSKLFPLLTKLDGNLFPKKKATIGLYTWALSTMWSRAFDVEVDGKLTRFLVPFVDMFNHSSESKAEHHWNSKTKCFEVTFPESRSVGSQVFINYGPLPNYKLLMFYGFVNDANPFDAVQLWASMSPEADMYALKQRILEQKGLPAGTSFDLRRGSLNEQLLFVLRVQRMGKDDIKLVNKAAEGEPMSKSNEENVLQSLQYSLQGMLDGYPSGSGDVTDHVRIQQLLNQNKDESEMRELMSLVLKKGEKIILEDQVDRLQKRLENL